MIPHRRSGPRIGLLVGALLMALLAAALPAGAADRRAPSPVPTTPLFSMRRLPELLLGAVADPKYDAALDTFFSKVAGDACAVVEQNGRIIYSRSPASGLAPASTIKLLTATAALDVLGPDSTLTTRIVAGRGPVDGVVEGDLTIIGAGDPLLVTAGYRQSLEDPDQRTEDFGAVADAIVAAGVRQVTGRIVGDDSALDRTRWLPSWPTRYQIGGVVGPLSALMVNDGQTGFTETPTRPNADRRPGDPPALAAATLRTLLIDRGVQVTGDAAAGRAPEDPVEVATFESVPIRDIVAEMLTDSDNTTAELLTRLMGQRASGAGTTAAGLTAIRSSLRAMGLPIDPVVMVDGSGLDTSNRVTCPMLIEVLHRSGPDGPIGTGLAVAGRTGTLRKRLLDSATAGRLRAKTGTLATVNALAGFAEPRAGSILTFAMIQNGSDPRGTGVTDGFAEQVVTYGQGPRLDALSPRPTR